MVEKRNEKGTCSPRRETRLEKELKGAWCPSLCITIGIHIFNCVAKSQKYAVPGFPRDELPCHGDFHVVVEGCFMGYD